MSIMLVAGEPEVAGAVRVDPDVRALLDHIAAELAQEYIRLMEAAARAEIAASLSVTDA
jgi:predicted transcriptional regulator